MVSDTPDQAIKVTECDQHPHRPIELTDLHLRHGTDWPNSRC